MLEIKESINLNYFTRYDANTLATSVKISTTGIFAPRALEAGKAYALYLNKAGTILVIKEDGNGVRLAKAGNSSQRFVCSRLLRDMLKLGVELPQTADLDWDADLGAYVARLKMAVMPSIPEAPPLFSAKDGRFRRTDA